jgi:TRAP transporter TAXI family solute receptor
MRRPFLLTLATLLAVTALGFAGYYAANAPKTLRVAVGPLASEDTRLVVAAAQYLASERASVRLKVVLTEGVAESAAAMEADKVDLAVVRSDVAMPAKGQTVAILHRNAAVLMTLERTGITRVSGLRGRKVGLLRRHQPNEALLQRLLTHYEIPGESVTPVRLRSPAEAADAFREGRIDALLVVASVTSRTMEEAVLATTQAAGAPPVFIPFGEAEALAQRSAAVESFEVVRGAFGGTPSRPADGFTTVSVSHRLLAQEEVDDSVISELTRLLFAMRPAIQGDVPLAARIEAPDTAKGALLPVHAGAASYYDGEVLTFFERYGDYFYLGVMALSILGSGAAWFASSAASRHRTEQLATLNRLFEIVRAAHLSPGFGALEALEAETDAILADALDRAGRGSLDSSALVALTLGLDQARRAIAERRNWLDLHGPPRSVAA